MAKWIKRGVAVFVVATILFAGVLWIAIDSREAKLARRTPPSPADLERLSAQLPPSVRGPATSNDATSSSEMPTALERTLSREELTAQFVETNIKFRRNAARAAAIFKVKEGFWSLVDPYWAAYWTWSRAERLMAIGEWDEAQRAFWEALDSDLAPLNHQFGFGQLAWLESDPAAAAYLLELSCRGDAPPLYLQNAVELTTRTGSTALAQHYRERLAAREAHPPANEALNQ